MNTTKKSSYDVAKAMRAAAAGKAYHWPIIAAILMDEVNHLRHHRDTTIGLWATDRPDLMTDEEKEKFFMFEIK